MINALGHSAATLLDSTDIPTKEFIISFNIKGKRGNHGCSFLW